MQSISEPQPISWLGALKNLQRSIAGASAMSASPGRAIATAVALPFIEPYAQTLVLGQLLYRHLYHELYHDTSLHVMFFFAKAHLHIYTGKRMRKTGG